MVILDGLEPFLSPLGPILGRLGGILAGLGASWGSLGRSCGGLGVVLGGLGAIFGWSWGGLGRSDRSRFGQQIDQKSDEHLRLRPEAILNRFWVVWGSTLDGSGVDLGGFGIDLHGFFRRFFWRARFDVKKCATSVPKVASKM